MGLLELLGSWSASRRALLVASRFSKKALRTSSELWLGLARSFLWLGGVLGLAGEPSQSSPRLACLLKGVPAMAAAASTDTGLTQILDRLGPHAAARVITKGGVLLVLLVLLVQLVQLVLLGLHSGTTRDGCSTYKNIAFGERDGCST